MSTFIATAEIIGVHKTLTDHKNCKKTNTWIKSITIKPTTTYSNVNGTGNFDKANYGILSTTPPTNTTALTLETVFTDCVKKAVEYFGTSTNFPDITANYTYKGFRILEIKETKIPMPTFTGVQSISQ